MGIKLIRGAILIAVLVVVLLGVGKYLQDHETIPGKATPVMPSVTGTSVGTATVAPSAVATQSPADLGKDAKTPPSGYAQSCAASKPWGQQVTAPFVCLDSPKAGSTVNSNLTISGYAGGAFENSVVLSFYTDTANGRVPGSGESIVPLVYTAPDIGMPGKISVNISMGGATAGTLHLTVSIKSPKDGSNVAQSTVDVKLQP
jgi:hypothetical protein